MTTPTGSPGAEVTGAENVEPVPTSSATAATACEAGSGAQGCDGRSASCWCVTFRTVGAGRDSPLVSR
ncbi:hypothetical protein ACFWN2_03905 [Lentzea sp. NPDC058436]|uniref:hypothetical protein n=1 Tax=Lentzea sp. NPDC058436 TaxID=3346499 RepID=UPI00365EACEF